MIIEKNIKKYPSRARFHSGGFSYPFGHYGFLFLGGLFFGGMEDE